MDVHIYATVVTLWQSNMYVLLENHPVHAMTIPHHSWLYVYTICSGKYSHLVGFIPDISLIPHISS